MFYFKSLGLSQAQVPTCTDLYISLFQSIGIYYLLDIYIFYMCEVLMLYIRQLFQFAMWKDCKVTYGPGNVVSYYN